MTYAIKRTYGKYGFDYLHAWDEKWGTSCMGSIKKAMTFATKEEAEAAAVRAQAECKGTDGKPVTGMTFSVVAIDSLKLSGIISELEDLSITLGGPKVRINTGVLTEGFEQPDIEGYVVGDRGVVPFNADGWAHGPSSQGLAERIAALRAAADLEEATQATEPAPQRPRSIVSIDAAELDKLLAPYISHGLLRTIYTASTRATEYRGPSGKLIAITIGRNHYRNRDAVLGSTPLALHQQFVGRIRRAVPYELVNPKTGEVVGSGTIGGQVIPFPGGAA